MDPLNKEKKESRKHLIPIIIFVIFIGITIIIGFFVRELNSKQNQIKFENEVDIIHQDILTHLTIYSTALFGGRGLFEASQYVDRDEWRLYVESLKIKDTLPGIQGIGYSEFVWPENFDQYIADIRDQGFPDFTIRPEGLRDVYSSITYLEPFDVRNQQAFGFDMYQNPIRRTAMDYARDNNTPSLSGRVTLVQEIDEDVQAGFLMYVPLYAKDSKRETLQERQQEIVGFVYSAFRMNNFMKSIASLDRFDIHVMIYDGVDINLSDKDKMYDNDLDYPYQESVVNLKRELDFGGNMWTVYYSANTSSNNQLATIIFIGGALVSFLLSFLSYTLVNRKDQALKLAQGMTDDLRKRTNENEIIAKKLEDSNLTLKDNEKKLQEKVNEYERLNKLMVDRELKMVELKNNSKSKE